MLRVLRNYIWNILEQNWHTLNYHGTRLKLPFNPRKGTCECCGRKGLTNIHHWGYFYTRKQVMQKPMLALNYTSEVCFLCHELGNSMRKLYTECPDLTLKNPSPNVKKMVNLRKKALKAGEKWAKLEEND